MPRYLLLQQVEKQAMPERRCFGAQAQEIQQQAKVD